MDRPLRHAASLIVFCLVPVAAWADVKPMSLFSDNMVLQRDMPLRIWGMASPGEQVAIALGDTSVKASADAQGRWAAMLPPRPAGGPLEMTISGRNTVTIKNVLVGEVWLASGQSNMDMKLPRADGGPEAVCEAADPALRFFTAGLTLAAEPARDVRGGWRVSTPQDAPEWYAAAYFFAREAPPHAGRGSASSRPRKVGRRPRRGPAVGPCWPIPN